MEDTNLPTTTPSGGVNVSGSADIVSGDFVGRDQDVFLGREVVGRDKYVINVEGSIAGDVVIYPNTALGRLGAQIERLRGRITRLIPAEIALRQLARLREPKPISELSIREFIARPLAPNSETRQPLTFSLAPDSQPTEDYLRLLGEIEGLVSPTTEPDVLSRILRELSNITDEINIRIAKLNSTFASIVYPTTTSRELVDNMVSKIGHQEYKDEAEMHLGVISQLVQKLNPEELTRPDFDVLSDEAYVAVGVMTELEQRRRIVERLVYSDRQRRNWTVVSVIAYISAAIALTIFALAQWGTTFAFGQVPLNQLRLPLLGIPWPVILWSLIGSFAAMIHRFNANPIYDFSDTVKWMITRPVQGVVLGSTFYLILVSGLFILTGENTSNPSGLVSADEVILVLCFLVGFSDRFADSVFNTLVQRYAKDNSDAEQRTNKK